MQIFIFIFTFYFFIKPQHSSSLKIATSHFRTCCNAGGKKKLKVIFFGKNQWSWAMNEFSLWWRCCRAPSRSRQVDSFLTSQDHWSNQTFGPLTSVVHGSKCAHVFLTQGVRDQGADVFLTQGVRDQGVRDRKTTHMCMTHGISYCDTAHIFLTQRIR